MYHLALSNLTSTWSQAAYTLFEVAILGVQACTTDRGHLVIITPSN